MARAPRLLYSRAERLTDAVVHISGLAFALIAVPVLILLTMRTQTGSTAIVAASVYGATLIAMIFFSALYNMVPHPRWTRLFRSLDHSAIYCKIAGTYTPFTLLPGGHGTWLLAGLWTAALAGSGLRVVSPDRLRWLALLLSLGMGWAGLFAGGAFFDGLSQQVIVLIVTGGVLYTVGLGFMLLDRMPFHYTIWHVFVLAATIVFYAAVTVHLVQTSG